MSVNPTPNLSPRVRLNTHTQHSCFRPTTTFQPASQGEFTIFVGLDQVLAHLKNFHFSTSDIDYIRQILPNAKPGELGLGGGDAGGEGGLGCVTVCSALDRRPIKSRSHT